MSECGPFSLQLFISILSYGGQKVDVGGADDSSYISTFFGLLYTHPN